MKKIVLGIIIGLLLTLFVGKTYADWQRLVVVYNSGSIDPIYGVIYDKVEHVNCYYVWNNGMGISCLKAER